MTIEEDRGGDITDAGDGAPNAGSQPASGAAPSGSDKPADAGDAGKTDGGDGKPAASNADWFGADWRDKLTTGLSEDQRPKAQAYLKTRSSPYDILRGAMSADQKISELSRDRIKIPTGKDDDPKDVAAYRKARGVPEAPEKYDVRIPEEVGELSGLDQELKNEFLAKAHKNNWGQKDVDFAMETWFANQRLIAAEQAKTVLRAQEAAIDELRVEYGREYKPNIELVNRMFQTELSEVGMTEAEERRAFLSQRFTNGMALGEHPAFVKMMVKIARERADDGMLVMGETTDGGDVDGRVNKIMGLMHTDQKEYERMQPELQKLIAVQNRRNKK